MTPFPRTAPLTAQQAAEVLNKQYMGFDPSDPNSPLGVTLSMAAQTDDFHQNVYCSPETYTSCFNGQADCRMSCSLFNKNMISKNYVVQLDFGRTNGYVFNQTMVESSLTKCAFVFDGASGNNYNNGCGSGAPGNDCSKQGNAFDDICPSTGKTCTANDPEVKGDLCAPFGPVAVPSDPTGRQCIFGGPALNYPEKDQPNHLRDMVTARMKTGNTLDHNEVVLDERVLIPAMRLDPVTVITAFIFSKSTGNIGMQKAMQMRDTFCQAQQVGQIPVVGVNDVSDFRPNGPFFVPAAEDSVADVVV